jgi:outer membrane cobalamin receptor
VGNPDLKPEVGSELELGVDLSAFGDRVTLELTHYRQHMTDVILSNRVAPSTGFASAPGHQRRRGDEQWLGVHAQHASDRDPSRSS